MSNQPEFWLAGPIDGITPMLQPVAHAILQAQREIKEALNGFPAELLWSQPGGVASPAFHIQHIAGVLDRLFTYARGEQLSSAQFEYLEKEGQVDDKINLPGLINRLDKQIEAALKQLRETSSAQILETRFVGRKQIPSNMLGLLFHAAEHTQRHTGQLLVTVRVLCSKTDQT